MCPRELERPSCIHYEISLKQRTSSTSLEMHRFPSPLTFHLPTLQPLPSSTPSGTGRCPGPPGGWPFAHRGSISDRSTRWVSTWTVGLLDEVCSSVVCSFSFETCCFLLRKGLFHLMSFIPMLGPQSRRPSLLKRNVSVFVKKKCVELPVWVN